jgi:hypothetical protein
MNIQGSLDFLLHQAPVNFMYRKPVLLLVPTKKSRLPGLFITGESF